MTDEKLSKSDIEAEISSGRCVIVEFFTDRCPYCVAMDSVLKNVSEEFENNQIKLIRINADEYKDIAQQYSIRSVPSFLLFENGKLTARRTGKLSEKQLLNMTEI